MKDIVYILPDKEGGVASVVRNLLLFSRHEDIRKTVILIGTKRNKNRIDTPFKCDKFHRLEFNKWDSPHAIYTEISNAIPENAIIVSNDGNHELNAIEYMARTNPVVFIMHGNATHYHNTIKEHTATIGATICVSNYLAQKLKDTFPNMNVSCIFAPIPISTDFDLSCKKKDDGINILYVGRVEQSKGCHLFPKFVELLESHSIPYNFHVIGDGPLLPALVADLKDRKNISFYGSIPHDSVLKIMRQCNMSILFSESEGLPLCLAEGMMFGLIPIAFDLPSGIHDLIEDGVNGYIVPQGDVYAAYKIIEKMYECPKKRQKMSDKSYLKGHNMFNPEEQVSKYEEVFRNAPLHKRTSGKFLKKGYKRMLYRLPMPFFYRIKKFL